VKEINRKCDITQFKNILLNEFAEKTRGLPKASVEEIVRNNGVIVEGITIEKYNTHVRPFFDIKDLYEDYCHGLCIDSIIDKMIKKPGCDKSALEKIVDCYKDFEYIRKNVMFKLINYNKNCECLKNVPHRRFLDLAIVYYCSFDCIQNANGNILVSESHMKMWEVDENMLYCCAMKNTPAKNKAILMDMKTMLLSLFREKQMPNMYEMQEFLEVQDDKADLYVLTNETKSFGAGVMIYENLIKKYAEENVTDYYIIPSSIHEVLLIPVQSKSDTNTQELTCIVKEVNDTQVLTEEILSYNVYYYSRKDGVISIA